MVCIEKDIWKHCLLLHVLWDRRVLWDNNTIWSKRPNFLRFFNAAYNIWSFYNKSAPLNHSYEHYPTQPASSKKINPCNVMQVSNVQHPYGQSMYTWFFFFLSTQMYGLRGTCTSRQKLMTSHLGSQEKNSSNWRQRCWKRQRSSSQCSLPAGKAIQSSSLCADDELNGVWKLYWASSWPPHLNSMIYSTTQFKWQRKERKEKERKKNLEYSWGIRIHVCIIIGFQTQGTKPLGQKKKQQQKNSLGGFELISA